MEDHLEWDWKKIFDQSDDSLILFIKEHKSLFSSKITELQQSLNTDSPAHQDVWKLENIVRKVLPVFVRITNDDKLKQVSMIKRLLQMVECLIKNVLNNTERQDSWKDGGQERLELLHERLKLGIVLVDLTRDFLDLGKTLQSDSVLMTLFHQVPPVLFVAFSHCRQSPSTYSDLLDSLSPDLKSLFLKSKVSLITLIEIVNESQERVSWVMLEKFVIQLDVLQKELLDLDFHAFGIVCKCYMRLCQTHWADLWEARFDPLPHFKFIVRKTESSVTNLSDFIQKSDEQGLKRESNIMVFYLKTISQQSQVFKESLSDKSQYYNQLISLGSALSRMDDLTTNFLTGFDFSGLPKLTSTIPDLVHSFFVQLLEDTNFAEYALSLRKSDLKLFPIGTVILWTKILSEIWSPNSSAFVRTWFKEDNSLFKLVVLSIDASHNILCDSPHLTGIQFGGKPLTSYTCYEYVLTRTQGFIAGLQPELLPHIEDILLETTLSPETSFWAKQLCIDAWVFLLRYGPAELCSSHVSLLVKIFCSLQDSSSQLVSLKIAIRRLSALLTSEDLKKLAREYPPKNHFFLWESISGYQRPESFDGPISLALSTFCQIDGSIDTFDRVISSIVILSQSWSCLDFSQRNMIAEVVQKVWFLLEKNQESILWDNNFVYNFMLALFKLSENIKDLKTMNLICSLCGKIGEPYLIECCSWILWCYNEKENEQQANSLSLSLIGVNNENGTKNLMFLDQLAKKKPSLSIKENIHKDNYFSNINIHCCDSTCFSARTETSLRTTKKRKLVDEDGQGCSEKLLNAIGVIRSEMKFWKISPTELAESKEALSVIERMSKKYS